jgi:hypothetical protein
MDRPAKCKLLAIALVPALLAPDGIIRDKGPAKGCLYEDARQQRGEARAEGNASMHWTVFGRFLWCMPLGFYMLALVQVMDQVDETLWQRLLRNVFIVVAQGLSYKSQE